MALLWGIERDPDLSGPYGDAGDLQFPAQIPQRRHPPQVHHLLGRIAELSVDNFIHQVVPVFIFHISEAMVQFQLVPGIVDVPIGDVGIQFHFDHRIRCHRFVGVALRSAGC